MVQFEAEFTLPEFHRNKQIYAGKKKNIIRVLDHVTQSDETNLPDLYQVYLPSLNFLCRGRPISPSITFFQISPNDTSPLILYSYVYEVGHIT